VDVIERTLRGIDGGRVLDVATQEGGFVQILMGNLKGYTEIVGIDIHERAIETAQSTIGQESVWFLVMNAEQLDFEDDSFDTASISASLHHLSNIQRVLEEMKRVLKPGGHSTFSTKPERISCREPRGRCCSSPKKASRTS